MKQATYNYELFTENNFPVHTTAPLYKKLYVHAHYHKAAELILITRGEGETMIGSRKFYCKEGDIIFAPPYTIHQLVSLNEDLLIRGIVYELSILEASHIDIKYDTLFDGYQKLYPIITSEHPCHANLKQYCELLLAADDTTTSCKNVKILSYLMLITSNLIEHFSLLETIEGPQHTRLRPVLQYIDKHLSEKITLSDLSNILYTCDDQLIRLFKIVTGETPIKYIQNLRIDAAMKLLTATDDSISAISDKAGFHNADYMNKLFKQKLGMTPREYRKLRASER